MSADIGRVLAARPVLVLAGGVVSMLVGVLAVEYHSAVTWEMRLPYSSSPSPSRAALGDAVTVTPDPVMVRQWSDGALARPLFSPSRRPVAASVAGPLRPRLAGIVIGPAGRKAIFAGAGGDRGVVAAIGQQAGDWRVVAIGPDAVHVVGPEGPRILRPARDDGATVADTSESGPLPPHASLLDLLRAHAGQFGDGAAAGSPPMPALPPALLRLLPPGRQGQPDPAPSSDVPAPATPQ